MVSYDNGKIFLFEVGLMNGMYVKFFYISWNGFLCIVCMLCSVVEFILYKLKEMEKISVDDILVLLECFRKLDVDELGMFMFVDIINVV